MGLTSGYAGGGTHADCTADCACDGQKTEMSGAWKGVGAKGVKVYYHKLLVDIIDQSVHNPVHAAERCKLSIQDGHALIRILCSFACTSSLLGCGGLIPSAPLPELHCALRNRASVICSHSSGFCDSWDPPGFAQRLQSKGALRGEPRGRSDLCWALGFDCRPLT